MKAKSYIITTVVLANCLRVTFLKYIVFFRVLLKTKLPTKGYLITVQDYANGLPKPYHVFSSCINI